MILYDEMNIHDEMKAKPQANKNESMAACWSSVNAALMILSSPDDQAEIMKSSLK